MEILKKKGKMSKEMKKRKMTAMVAAADWVVEKMNG